MPVSLHTHSWYSLREGVSAPEALLERAARLGYGALALTDTNNLYAAVRFVERARRHGVRPLLGARLTLGPARCVALVGERIGYRNLCRILSRLHLSCVERSAACGFASDPHELARLLCDNPDGLHVLTDDLVLAGQLREAFGRRLWLEVVRPHPGGSPREAELLEGGARLGLEPVASTAVHFATPQEYATYRLVTASRQNTLLDRLPAHLPVTPAHHLPEVGEFRRRFGDLPAAIRHGEELAELLRSDVLPEERVLPRPRLPRGVEEEGYLHRLCERGLRRRDLGADLEARRRLREELAVITEAGLSGYFLTVRDLTRSVRRAGHSMALRGSAGNSLVCYLLEITDVNPLRFGLSPERFLHPGRADLPDIDLDFDWKVRDRVLEHVVRRYGERHTARISSHLFFQPRSAFREAGKVHGLSDGQVSDLSAALDRRVEDLVLPAPGDRAIPRLPASFPLEPERWPRLLADARRLLGRPHHLSLHPGGIVLTPGPIEDHVPLQRAALLRPAPEGAAPEPVIMTQFEKDAIESTGLVKIDLLGNRALATVDEARRLALVAASLRDAGGSRSDPPTRQHGPALLRLSNTDLALGTDGDPATVALLQRGDTLGVNQLESPAMRHLLIQMRPAGLGDVIQSLALLRPGAASIGMKENFIRRRHGLEEPPPLGTEVLADTHGLMLYEDDTLQVIRALTGLPAPDADRFRKRITGCADERQRQALREVFLGLCGQGGMAEADVAEFWLQLAKFDRYAFCKSHAVSYGLLAWNGAYLKAHHPTAFWAAALNNNQGSYPRRVYIEAVKRAGLRRLGPCLNRSEDSFRPETCLDGKGAIRVGLGAIAGLPQELRQHLIDERERGGPYRDLADLRRRIHPGREALATLIRAGALDFTGRNRPALFLQAELQDRAKDRPGQGELFAHDLTGGWSPADYGEGRRLRDEWELFGFVLGPPLFRLLGGADVSGNGTVPWVASDRLPAYAGRLVRVRGLVATARHLVTENDRAAQFITLEDEHGLAEVTLFEGTCPPLPHLTIGPYEATGVVEERYGAFGLTARAFGLVG
jgi:DNA-directed DNA polymerase III PolC